MIILKSVIFAAAGCMAVVAGVFAVLAWLAVNEDAVPDENGKPEEEELS